jgi:hypothetical protein
MQRTRHRRQHRGRGLCYDRRRLCMVAVVSIPELERLGMEFGIEGIRRLRSGPGSAREAVKAADYHDSVEDAEESDVSRCEPPIAA